MCTRDELQGVVAHELAHINNRDSLYMMMAASMVSIISLVIRMFTPSRRRVFSRTHSRYSQSEGLHFLTALLGFLILALLALSISVFTTLIYYSISRKREYLADATGALYTRYPEGLASALEKISGNHAPITSADTASAPLYIVNPLKGNLTGWFSTHPSTQSRIKILRLKQRWRSAAHVCRKL